MRETEEATETDANATETDAPEANAGDTIEVSRKDFDDLTAKVNALTEKSQASTKELRDFVVA